MAARKRYSITITSGEKKLQANHVALMVPEISEVTAAIEAALKKNFETVETDVKAGVNLQEWCGLVEKGLGGKPRLCEVGGVDYLFDSETQRTSFQVPDVVRTCGFEGVALAIGAGAASAKVVGKNAELILNTLIPGPRGTKYACIDRPLDDDDDEEDDEDSDLDMDGPPEPAAVASARARTRSGSGVGTAAGGGHKRTLSDEVASGGAAGYSEPTTGIYATDKRKSLSRSREAGDVPTPVAAGSPAADLKSEEKESAAPMGADLLVPVVAAYPSEETGCLCNMFLCEGKQVPLIYVKAKKRTGEANFTNTIREGLKSVAGCSGDKQIGMGGVIKVNSGKIRGHIMPSFPKGVDKDDEAAVNKWLRFYDFGPELVMYSTLLTDDPTPEKKLHLRLEHTHFHSLKPGTHEGGHYHYDVTPDEIEYEGYFSLAEYVYRVEDATHNLEMKRAKAAAESATA